MKHRRSPHWPLAWHPGRKRLSLIAGIVAGLSGGGAPSAFPVIEATSTGGSAAAVASFDVTLPAGVQVGDGLLVLVSCDANQVPGHTGTAWQRVFGSSESGTSTGFAVFWKVADGSDTLTVTFGVSETYEFIAYRLSNARFSALTGQSYSGASFTTPTSNTPPGGARDYLWIVGVGMTGNNNLTAPSPGYGDLINVAVAGSSSAAAFSREANTATEAPGAFTPSGTNVRFTVTIAISPAGLAEWVTTANHTPGTLSPGWAGYTLRQVIPVSALPAGSKVRLTLMSGTAAAVIDDCRIGFRAASGDVYDFQSAPTVVTVGGNSGFTIPAGQATVVTDEITIPTDGVSSLVLAVHFSSGDTTRVDGIAATWPGYWKNANDAATVDATGYTNGSTTYMVKQVEVFLS